MKMPALFLPKLRRKFLFLNLIISFAFLLFLLPKESFAYSTHVYFDVTPPSGDNYSVVSNDQAANPNLCGQPLQCANSHNEGNCQLQTCPAGGNDWTKYQLTCVQYTDPFFRISYESYYQQAGIVYSIGDKCTSGGPYLEPGYCETAYGGPIYKTCCSNSGNALSPSACIPFDTDGAGDLEGRCPTGYTREVFCGPGTGVTCGQSACGPVATAVDGGWSIPDGPTWDATCSVSCGGGTKTRTCNNPTPANGGSECKRDDGTYTTPADRTETESCNLGACPTCSVGDTISCDAKWCLSNSAVCATGVQDCLADGSGYSTTCSVVTDNCASQCTSPTPTPSPSGQCNYGACGAAGGCTAGSRYVSGSNCPSWYTNPGCYQDATCPSSGGGCVGPNCNVLSDYACWEYVSKDATNWSTTSVSAIGGDTVYFKMDVKALKDSLSFYVRNKFDDWIDGYTNIYQNTNKWNNWVPPYDATPLRGMGDSRCWGWPGFCPDWHNYNANGDIEDWGSGTGMTGNRANAWSVVVNSDAQIFKNKPFVATDGSISPGRNLRFGNCVPQSDPNLPGYNNGTCCWQDPASGGPTCITMKTYCDGVPCNCNPAWGECQFGMSFQCNTVTVNTTETVSGYVKNSSTNTGIPGVTVQVYDDAFKNLNILDTQTVSTGPDGHWEVKDFVRTGDFYAVRVTGNLANPKTAPTGYAPPAKTSTLGWTWNYAANPNTDVPLGSASYEGQLAGSNDCAGFNNSGVDGRCSFVYDSDKPKGYLDGADCASFSGWSCDASNYNQPIDVHFYADGQAGSGSYLGKANANQPREQAVADLCGGKPNHGFTFTTPASLKDGQNHSIWAYSINIPAGNNPLLSNVPKTINCPAAAAKYTCNGTSCVPNVNGTYPSLAACNAACGGGGGPNTPWIQTTGGDVHSNTKINTPGGP